MQLHILTLILALAFNTLCLTPVIASHTRLAKRDFKSNQGYRCGERVLRQELLEIVAKEAESEIIQSNYGSLPIDSTYPMVYTGPLKFNEDGNLWLWPLSMLAQSSSEPEAYFLVLGIGPGTGPAQIIGVIRQKNRFQGKCIRESDLSDMDDNDFAFGYRCPLTIFSFETLSESIQKAKETFHRRLNSPVTNIYPFHVPTTKDFKFIEEETAWLWPISANGQFNGKVSTSIIMNKNFELLGMVYKKDSYHRCILTANDRIKPRFILPGLQKQDNSMISESVDVFQCDNQYILSSQVLIAVFDVLQRLAEKMKKGNESWYPLAYIPSSYSGSRSLYKWPFRIDSSGCYQQAVRFNFTEKLFAIIDDFSNVYSVVMKHRDGTLIDCPRVFVSETTYLESLGHQRFIS